jgi:murein DD-endopeptidase MepM/ murein hydrolase activator NlpD
VRFSRHGHVPIISVPLAALSAFLLLLAFGGRATASPAIASSFPRLRSLGPEDPLFVQQQAGVAEAYAAMGSGSRIPDLTLYEYLVPKGADLFALAARLSLPYETVATLNGLDRSTSPIEGRILLVSSTPGVFVPERTRSDLDLILACRPNRDAIRILVGGRALWFFPGASFTQEERSLFIGRLFRFPLPTATVTSGFGPRLSPITGRISNHPGIDLGAPAGTSVYAAREGRILYSGFDAQLGEHLIVGHEGGWSTVYGHLSQRLVSLNDRVDSGMVIGRVGSTGQSTGPHLHFEVRNGGEAHDPGLFVPRTQR